jgi:Cu+-exporting ATPase
VAPEGVLNALRAIAGVACVQLKTDPVGQKHSAKYVVRGTASFDDIVSVAKQAGVSIYMDSFEVTGMMCVVNCAVKVKDAALSVDGVHSAEVDYENKVLHIIYSEKERASQIHDEVAVAVQSAGYDVEWAGKNNLLNIKVDGMFCGHCVQTVRKAVSSLNGVRHVAVNLEQRIAAVATDPEVASPDTLYSEILKTIEEVGFGAEVYAGNRNITVQLTRKAKPENEDLRNKDLSDEERLNLEILNPLRAVPGVACVQMKEGQSFKSSGSGIHPLEILIRGTTTYEDVLASTNLQDWDIILTSISYDSKYRDGEVREYEHSSAGSTSSAGGKSSASMKRGAALLMEEISVVSDIIQPNGNYDLVAAEEESLPTRSVFSVKGMSCGACVAAVERVLRKHKCISKVAVALLTEKVEVQYDSAAISSDDIIQDIVDAGYEAALLSTSTGSTTVSRQFLVAATQPTKMSEMRADYDNILITLKETEGVLESFLLQGSELQQALDDSEELVQQATTLDADKVAVSNGAFVLEVMYDSSLLGLRNIFDTLNNKKEKYIAFILPAKGDGADIFEKQKQALKKLELSFYFSLAFTLPLAVVMWSGALMHVMVVPGLSAAALIVTVLATPVQFISGSRFYREAYRGIRVGTYGMGLLIALGTSFAYFFGVYSLIYSIVTKGDVEAYPDHIMTAAMLITFMLLGKVMEIRAKLRTSSALKTLMDRQPKSAILLNPMLANGDEPSAQHDDSIENEREIPIELIQQDDIVKVIRGMSVPADGEVVFGHGEVNEALITGEALPVNKTIGSAVIGGTVLQDGMIHVVVKAAPENSMLQQIIHLVEGAQMQKAPIQQVADAIAGVFTIIIVSLAIMVFVLWMSLLETESLSDKHLPADMSNFNLAFTLAVSTLVVACPCAMGLATPTAIMVGTGVGAKFGVLIKGGEALENANRISTVVFDKTGTLTVGCPSVTGVYILSNTGAPRVQLYEGTDTDNTGRVFDIHANGIIDKDSKGSEAPPTSDEFYDFLRLMWLTGCAEVSSEHVLGRAIVQHASDVPGMPSLREPEEMKAITGKGVECTINDVKVLIGSLSYLQQENVKHSDNNSFVSLAENIQGTGAIVIFVAMDGVMCSFMQLADSARPESKDTVKALQDRGIAVWMVTGDNIRTANSMGAVVGIPEDHIIAGALPNTKIDHVKKLQMGQVVGFVGDGINDGKLELHVYRAACVLL